MNFEQIQITKQNTRLVNSLANQKPVVQSHRPPALKRNMSTRTSTKVLPSIAQRAQKQIASKPPLSKRKVSTQEQQQPVVQQNSSRVRLSKYHASHYARSVNHKRFPTSSDHRQYETVNQFSKLPLLINPHLKNKRLKKLDSNDDFSPDKPTVSSPPNHF